MFIKHDDSDRTDGHDIPQTWIWHTPVGLLGILALKTVSESLQSFPFFFSLFAYSF